MFRLSLRSRLALFYSVLFAVLLTVTGAAIYRIVALRSVRAIDDDLADHCHGMWGYIKFENGKPILEYDTEDHEVLYFVRDATPFYQLYRATDGMLLLESEDSARLHLAISPKDALRRVQGIAVEQITINAVPLRFRSALFRHGDQSYLLRVGLSVEAHESSLAQVRLVLLALIPVACIFAIATGWLLAGRALTPLHEMSRAAGLIGISQLHRRLPIRGTRDEVDGLAVAFNGVLARLEEAVGRMRQFSASMSHELRTPLTVLQGEAELALMHEDIPDTCRNVLSSQLEEIRKLKRLINGLLILCKAEAGEIHLDLRPFNVSELVSSLCNSMLPVAENKGVTLMANCSESVVIQGDSGWIERAVLNLLDNAIKFTPSGGRIEVTTSLSGNQATIEFRDTGIGIAPEALPHIFDRFYSRNANRTGDGTGLGLALVKWILDEHGATVSVESVPGVGSLFSLAFSLNHAEMACANGA